jgi:hypothetical protein
MQTSALPALYVELASAAPDAAAWPRTMQLGALFDHSSIHCWSKLKWIFAVLIEPNQRLECGNKLRNRNVPPIPPVRVSDNIIEVVSVA